MKLLQIGIIAVCFLLSMTVKGVELDSIHRDSAYVKTILGRSQKIVDKLNLKDPQAAENVLYLIANRYFELNDIYEKRDAKVEGVKVSGLTGEAKQTALKSINDEKDAALYRSHFAFPATLSLYLNNEQVETVKDGMTYGVVRVTYKATLEMIPSLTEKEKAQIYAWLVEAREFAMDAENSNKKHEAFGKYKGRINNYLSKHGYDLTKEREEWMKRIEAQKKK